MRSGRTLTPLAGLTRVAVLALALIAPACAPDPPAPSATSAIGIAQLMSGEDPSGFARATEPPELVFPRDHGAHPAFRTEWWYLTGNVRADDGRELGFHLTIFRNALTADPPARASAWATRDVYMGHLAITDPASGTFLHRERFARGALGLAGCGGMPLTVWLEDWRIEVDGAQRPVLRARAACAEGSIDLVCRATKDVVAHGEGGLSRKGALPGNASIYYSLTRLETTGTIEVAGAQHRVRGTAWFDREWSTSALEPGHEGWDWFGLRLDDGRELMLYRLRLGSGEASPASGGTLVAADGSARHLACGDVTLTPTRTWSSPRGDAAYPVAWRILVPSEALVLDVAPIADDQEHARALVRYWEGAVRVSGTARDAAASGVGYLELVGYAR